MVLVEGGLARSKKKILKVIEADLGAVNKVAGAFSKGMDLLL